MNESDFVPCPKCKNVFEGAKKLLRQKTLLIGKLEVPMSRELGELYDLRIDHLAACEVCSPEAWIEGGELCDEGEAIRRRIEGALSQEQEKRKAQLWPTQG